MNRTRLLVGGVLLALIAGGAVWSGRRSGGEKVGRPTAGRSEVEGGGAARRRPELPVDPMGAARGAIAGHVRDGAGEAIGGAEVCAWGQTPELGSDALRQPACAKTGADGAYRLEQLFAASWRVSASAPTFQPARWRSAEGGRLDLRIGAGETKDGVDLVLEGGGVEAGGRVSDLSGGPIAGAVVMVESGRRSSAGMVMARTDADGRFSVWTTPGPLDAIADADGYAPGWDDGIAPGSSLEILLTPETVLVGRVVEAEGGAPVPGAHVSASGGSWLSFDDEDTDAVSDADGRFRIERLEPGRYKPRALAAGRLGVAQDSVLLGLGQTSDEVIIRVHAGAMVEGRVTAGGQPCVDGQVSLNDPVLRHRASAPIEPDGRVIVRAMLPGRYDVRASCRDFPTKTDFEPVEVAREDVTGLVWAVDAGLSVRGEVVDGAGKPVAGARVSASVKGGDPRGRRSGANDTTRADGQFELRGLIAGQYAVEVDPPDGRIDPEKPTEVDVQADVTGVRFVIEDAAGGTIDGVVLDDTGQPLPGLMVVVHGKTWSNSRQDTQTGDDGRFSLKGLRAGEYRVVAQRDWRELRAPGENDDDVHGTMVTVVVGKSAHATLRVESTRASLSGRVVDAQGAPVTDAFVSAVRESDSATSATGSNLRESRWQWRRQAVLTDVDGRFTVSELARGRYTVRAFRKGGGDAFAEHVATGSEVTLTIDLPGSMTGTVVAADGAIPEEFTVLVIDQQSGFRRAESFFRSGGAWSMRDLPAGKYQVSADAAQGTAVAEVTLGDSEQKTGVRLELSGLVTVRGRVVDLTTGAPVAGMIMVVRPLKGTGGTSRNMDGPGAKKHITDSDGRFEIVRAPTGRVRVMGSPRDWEANHYGTVVAIVTLEPDTDADVGDLHALRDSLTGRDRPGDLGYDLKDTAPGTEPEDFHHVVGVVRADGPAARAGLAVGDEIVTVGGHDVVGVNAYRYGILVRVKEGAEVVLGVKRGSGNVVVTVKAGRPL